MTAEGIRAIENHGVPSDLSARRTVARQHEQFSCLGREYSESLLSDRGCEAHLLVVLSERCFNGAELGLDLDDEDGIPATMERQDVDRASFAISGIARLRHDVPAQSREPGNHRSDDRGVPLVEQAIQRRPSPAQLNVNIRADGRRDPAECPHGHLIDAAELRAGHALLADPGFGGDVDLAPVQLQADGTQRPTKSKIPHTPSIADGAYPAATETG